MISGAQFNWAASVSKPQSQSFGTDSVVSMPSQGGFGGFSTSTPTGPVGGAPPKPGASTGASSTSDNSP